ncbi:N-acetylmuramoyl-L-alanine amidase [Hymenobacter koreensis]|uniref:N-acetylmuramoyl-L-alanine amidase domain-containing protein n=1 Tax=Hymenobacter koreensis TaxID=1084523 RepID=A0ABP8JJZ4_9BACT
MRAITKLFVHFTGASAAQSVESILNHWRNHNMWGSVPGYHILVEPDGTAHRLYPDDKPTYGVAGHNKHSLHVCFIGDGAMTAAQEATIIKRLRYWTKLYPSAEVLGHRDVSPDLDRDGVVEPHEWVKRCPGFSVREWWAKVK